MANSKTLKTAIEMIKAAKNPLVSIASGANRHTATKSITKFIDQSGLYFFTTQMGKGVVDERHPKCLGTSALSENDYLHCAIDRADLIINIGHDVSEKPPFFMSEESGKKVIHVSYFPAEMDDVYFPQLEVLGCTAENISKLGDLLEGQDGKNEYFEKVKAEIDKNVYAKSDCLLYTSPSPRDATLSRMPSSA